MNDRPLLSICIATFNRLKHIKRQVQYLRSELEEIKPGTVEVIISNNASEDGTYEYLQSIEDPDIMINHNEENIGGIGNMARLLHMATGKYFWLPGDDDYLKKGLVKRIVSLLEQYDLFFLYLSQRGIREQDKKVTVEGKTHCVEYDKLIKVKPKQLTKLLVENYGDLKFQTSGVLKREIALKCEKEYAHLPEMVRGSNFTTYRAIRSMQQGPSYFISDIVVLGGDEILWKSLYIDYTLISDGQFIDYLRNCGFTDRQCKKIRDRQTAAIYSRALLDKAFMSELKRRGYPEWKISLIPIMLRLALRKIPRKLGISRYYEKKNIKLSDFGIHPKESLVISKQLLN